MLAVEKVLKKHFLPPLCNSVVFRNRFFLVTESGGAGGSWLGLGLFERGQSQSEASNPRTRF